MVADNDPQPARQWNLFSSNVASMSAFKAVDDEPPNAVTRSNQVKGVPGFDPD
jgi:hypothetical protein